MTVTADPALCMVSEPIEDDRLLRDGIDKSSCLVGMSVREPGPATPDIDHDRYHGLLADAADFMIDRYNAHVVFIPMERSMRDMQHSHAVVSKMLRPQHATVLKGDYSPGQLLYIMNRFTFAVGMRLHFLIFAALQDIPFVALPYSAKVQGFLQDMEIEIPPLELVNAGRLIAHITDHGEGVQVFAGWPDRLVQRMVREKGAVKPSLNTGYTVPFDPEIFKQVAMKMLDEQGVKILLHAFASGILQHESTGGTSGVIFETKYGPLAVRAHTIVDCTGDGDVAAFAGAGFEVGRKEDGRVQPVTLMFR
ncbi:MAG: FAD-dependent oxidoreductase [Desulfovermiculus sp.]